jgi:hypothetical protein
MFCDTPGSGSVAVRWRGRAGSLGGDDLVLHQAHLPQGGGDSGLLSHDDQYPLRKGSKYEPPT